MTWAYYHNELYNTIPPEENLNTDIKKDFFFTGTPKTMCNYTKDIKFVYISPFGF